MANIYNFISPQISAEIRGWITILLGIFAFMVSYRTYLNNQKQRKLENSFKLIYLFKESLQEEDIEIWKDIYFSSSESSGAKEGFFVMHEYEEGYKFPTRGINVNIYYHPEAYLHYGNFIIQQFPFIILFSEASPDRGAIQRITELFDLISFQILSQTVDEQLIYFELGQLMDTINLWLSFIDNSDSNESFLQEHFPSFSELYEKRIIQKSWKTKTYTNIE